MNGPVVFVVLVVLTVPFIEVNIRQNINKLFLCVRDVTQQFIVKAQDSSPVLICIPLVIDLNMGSQLFLYIVQLF